MGHYDSCYEYDEKYGREPHLTELQKANRKIKELEENLSKAAEVKFSVNGIEKTFRLDVDDGDLFLCEVDKDGENVLILDIQSNGTYYRPKYIYTEGWELNSKQQIKQDNVGVK